MVAGRVCFFVHSGVDLGCLQCLSEIPGLVVMTGRILFSFGFEHVWVGGLCSRAICLHISYLSYIFGHDTHDAFLDCLCLFFFFFLGLVESNHQVLCELRD